MRYLLSAALVLGLAGCSASPGDAAPQAGQVAPTVHPVSGLRVVPLTVVHGGERHVFQVEVARTDADQARGLMFRSAMGADAGMIFPMDPPREASFWMRNTLIPLDIIFVGTDGRISNIAANAVPYDETPLSSIGRVKAVLELNGGRAAQLGIVAGDKVEWQGQ
ncbi:MAG: hypothetical protein RLZZ84_712 [Pseudomonadota bacterium]|jgi:uncharacterized membrane protein (UPF0127 family)